MSFDFGLTLPDTLDYQRRAGSYWGEVNARAQQEWDNRRVRDAADREGRMQRELGLGNMEAYRQRRGQFDNRNGVLQNLRRGDQTPYPVTDENGTTGTAGTGAQTETSDADYRHHSEFVRPLSLTAEEMNGLFQHRGGTVLGFRQYSAEEIANSPQLRDMLERGQRHMQLQIDEMQDANGQTVYRVQRRTQGTVSDQNFAIPEPRTFLGMPLTGQDARRMRGRPIVPWGNPEYGRDRRENDAEIARRSRTTNVTLPGQPAESLPSVDPSADLQTSSDSTLGTSGTSGTSGTNTPQVYLGTNDTSGPLQMTPDMELMDMSIQDSMRNAEIYARYGRNDLAEQAMNMAITGQAAMHQQENILLLRATAEGNMDAAARLVERLNGRRPNTARFAPYPGDRTRFVLMVRGSDGVERSTYETPITRDQLYASFETAVDAVGSAQRRAATADVENNIRDNNTRIYVANREFEARALASFTEAQIARFRAEQERATAAGSQLRMLSDGDGGVYTTYPIYHSDGRVEHVLRQISVGQVQTPGVDGTTTGQGLIIHQATTGTVGTSAGIN